MQASLQVSVNTAFEGGPPSSPVQPDASKQGFLAVSLLYTERTDGDVPDRPLTARQVAEALGVGVEAVRELCRRGLLEHFRIVNAIRIPRGEFERFVRENLSRRRARNAAVRLEHVLGSSSTGGRRRRYGLRRARTRASQLQGGRA
jgi:excisionase family DNA binding protein